MKRFVIATLVTGLAFAASASAADKPRKPLADLEATFKKLDKNNDGKLNKEEFSKIIEELAAGNPDKAARLAEKGKTRFEAMFTKLDENKDDALNLEEFKKFDTAFAAGGKGTPTDLDASFKKLDGNKDNKLSKEEFGKILDQYTEANPDRAAKVAEKIKPIIDEKFTTLDENKDGSLSLEEYKKFTGLKGEKRKKTIAPDGTLFIADKADKKAKKADKKKGGDLEALFKKLDTNNDNKLSKEEFAKVIEEGKKKAKKKVAAADVDKKAKKKAAKKAKKGTGVTDTVFTKLDENKDGSLSLDEFKKYTGLKGEKKKKKNA